VRTSSDRENAWRFAPENEEIGDEILEFPQIVIEK